MIKKIFQNSPPPSRVFLTGVPGSRWSGIAQEIEEHLQADTSDRTSERQYSHTKFSGHCGAYFGTGMEFPASLNKSVLDAPYQPTTQNNPIKCRVHKSHEWAYMLDEICSRFPESWIVFVYRDDKRSYDWWKEAGGWNIHYPNYSWYVDDFVMQQQIHKQNNAILNFALSKNLSWIQHSDFPDIFLTVHFGGQQ